MTPRERFMAVRPILLRVVGYPLCFVTFFVLFLYWTFPYDRLKEAIIAAAEAPPRSRTGRAPAQSIQLAIDELGPTFFPGLRAKRVTVTFLPQRAGDEPTTMELDEAVVHVSLLGLLSSHANLDFDLEVAGGGTIEGEASVYFGAATPQGLRSLEAELAGVRLGQLGPVVAAVGLPLGGTVDGTLKLDVPDGNVRQAEGEVRLVASGLTIGNGRAQYRIPQFGGVTIEQIRAGRLNLGVDIRRGVATLQNVASHSAEMDLQMDGRVSLRPNLNESAMALGIRFRLTDVYRNKSEQAGRILSVMDMVPDFRRARRPDGMISLRCTGTFERGPVCGPDTGAAPGVGAPPGF